MKLHEAYQILSKPQSRREYDVSIAHLFHFQQTMARHGYTSHYPNSSDMPGGMGSTGPTYEGYVVLLVAHMRYIVIVPVEFQIRAWVT